MGRQLARIAGAAIVAGLIIAAVAVAKPEKFQVGRLFLRDNGRISPTRLPRQGQAPVTGNLVDEIGTTDGSHPPAIRGLIADFDKSIHVNAVGLPVCRKGQLEASSTATVRKACPDAIVGTGAGEVEVAFPEQAPFSAKGPITLFNGGVRGGTTTLFVHAYVNVPAPTAVVVTAKITRIHRGHFGLHVVAQIPVIAGGAGSPTNFDFKIHRTFTYRGREVSYLTASCPTGHYFAEGQVRFSDDTTLQVAHDLPCTPTG